LSNPAYREEIEAFISAHYPAKHPDIVDWYSVHFCHTSEAARLIA